MQNDKVAASRAIAQNRQLKIQLEELEKAFIQLVKLYDEFLKENCNIRCLCFFHITEQR